MNTEKAPTLNLYQKLALVRKAVPYLKKETKGQHGVYATESQVVGAIREALDEHGLLLYQDMLECNATSIGLLAKISYTWVDSENPSDTLTTNHFMAENGFDAKTIGKILTYSMRYYLLKFFNVPTDKDDPEAFQERVASSRPVKLMGIDKARELVALSPDDDGKTYDMVCKRFGVEDWQSIPDDQYAYIKNGLEGMNNG